MPPAAVPSPLASLEPRRHWWCLLLVAALAFMVGLDFLAVSLALPLMALDLGVGLTLACKVPVVYLLVGACLLPVGRGLARRMGSKRLLLWGAGLFWVASLLCGLSPGMGELLAARAAQGLGAALMAVAGSALLGRGDRGLGLAALAATLGAMAGAALGALAAQHLGWRPVFWLNLPLGAAVILAGIRLLPATPPADRGSGLDLVGALLLMGGLYFVISALDLGQVHGPADLRPWLSLALGAGCLATLWPWERRTPAPVILLPELREPGLAWGLAALLGGAALAGGALLLLPFYLVDLLGLSPLRAGLLLVLAPAAALFLGWVLATSGQVWNSRNLALALGLGALAGVVGVERIFSLSLPASLVRGGVHFTQAGLPQEALAAAFGHAFLLIPALALAAVACVWLSRRARGRAAY
ncbi:MAG: MFS transporter [Proteobacteria bacterium]|nr:MFS transporter [Pseudomonadota bacterium]MBU4575815.1 MFS transporter [Pseudomonadota bacterium]MBU4598937.1 MFS transporter [Pseudomonadota bacterium]MBV1716881.1 MFS transporter [Desulfarculus sp.]MBV1752801.1 MFS transporter [Desulfarculus sp.]